MPGGHEYYQACLDYHLGTHLTPSQIHSLGYREVERLEGLMRKVRTEFVIGYLYSCCQRLHWLKQKQIPEIYVLGLFENYVISDYAAAWIYRENVRIPPILAYEKPPTRQKGKRLQIYFQEKYFKLLTIIIVYDVLAK